MLVKGDCTASLGVPLFIRLFEIELKYSPNCSGKLKIIAVALESAVIERILMQLGLQARAPVRERQMAQAG